MSKRRGITKSAIPIAIAAALSAACGAPEATEGESRGDVEVRLLDAPDAEYVATPAGRFHRSCLHEVPEGAVVDELGNIVRDGKLIESTRSCAYEQKPAVGLSVKSLPPPGEVQGGWLQSIHAEAPPNPWGGAQEFTLMTANMLVPKPPKTNDGQLVYVFPGLAPFNGLWILQPVLQYGIGSPAGGGYQWHFVSYFVREGNAFFGPRKVATPGETIATSVFIHHSYTTPSGTFREWNVKATGASGTSLLAVSIAADSRPFRAYGAALEGYNFEECNELPNEFGIRFPNTRIFMPSPQGLRQLVDPTWYPDMRLDPANCGFEPVVVNSTSLRLNL